METFSVFDKYWIAAAGSVVLGGAFLLRTIYRLFFHPLAKFPGPKLAAITYKYEFYYDGIKEGQYTRRIEEMHKQYGPVIRINPDELHANDPKWIDLIYTGAGKKRDKFPYFVAQFGLPSSVFGTVSHDLHRQRRATLNPFFSRQRLTRFEPTIHGMVNKLCDNLENLGGGGKPVVLETAFSCLTTDVVTEYAFGHAYNFLDSPNFSATIRHALMAGMAMGHTIKQWPWLFPLMQSMPDTLMTKLLPEMRSYLGLQADLREQVKSVQNDVDRGITKFDPEQPPTIFHTLLASDIPEGEKNNVRLGQEAQAVVGAGTETTAWTLSVVTWFLVMQPETLTKLRAELEAAVPNPKQLPSWPTLEQLPYLIKGLRLSFGTVSRLARISPDEPIVLPKTDTSPQVVVPAGTPVGMTIPLVHLNPAIFPDPYKFMPERWLNVEGKRKKDLDAYLISFARGTRQCLGMNLAYAELFLCVTAIVRRVIDRIELIEPREDDVRFYYDYFVPTTKNWRQGIRAVIK